MRHPTLLGLVVGFIVLTIVFRLLELMRTRDKRQAWFRAGYLTDLAYWLFTPLVTRVATSIAVALVAAPIAYILWGRVDRDLIMHGWGPAGRLPLWAQAIGLLVVGDFIGYWVHRASHRLRAGRVGGHCTLTHDISDPDPRQCRLGLGTASISDCFTAVSPLAPYQGRRRARQELRRPSPAMGYLFGTYHMPKEKVPALFGTDTQVPSGLVGQIVFPFRRG